MKIQLESLNGMTCSQLTPSQLTQTQSIRKLRFKDTLTSMQTIGTEQCHVRLATLTITQHKYLAQVLFAKIAMPMKVMKVGIYIVMKSNQNSTQVDLCQLNEPNLQCFKCFR